MFKSLDVRHSDLPPSYEEITQNQNSIGNGIESSIKDFKPQEFKVKYQSVLSNKIKFKGDKNYQIVVEVHSGKAKLLNNDLSKHLSLEYKKGLSKSTDSLAWEITKNKQVAKTYESIIMFKELINKEANYIIQMKAKENKKVYLTLERIENSKNDWVLYYKINPSLVLLLYSTNLVAADSLTQYFKMTAEELDVYLLCLAFVINSHKNKDVL
ncbi:hypothetical protein K502DRAFT_361532 [Neoconidiobolus thromboides FSU 785]|nr:hypothetical protein K502DRAFT_361532 [Neoconidiobolus thromboides FSU 785]